MERALTVRPGWVVVGGGDRRPSGAGLTERQAIDAATELLRARNGGDIVVLDRVGKIALEIRVGV